MHGIMGNIGYIFLVKTVSVSHDLIMIIMISLYQKIGCVSLKCNVGQISGLLVGSMQTRTMCGLTLTLFISQVVKLRY